MGGNVSKTTNARAGIVSGRPASAKELKLTKAALIILTAPSVSTAIKVTYGPSIQLAKIRWLRAVNAETTMNAATTSAAQDSSTALMPLVSPIIL